MKNERLILCILCLHESKGINQYSNISANLDTRVSDKIEFPMHENPPFLCMHKIKLLIVTLELRLLALTTELALYLNIG